MASAFVLSYSTLLAFYYTLKYYYELVSERDTLISARDRSYTKSLLSLCFIIACICEHVRVTVCEFVLLLEPEKRFLQEKRFVPWC